MVAAAGEGRRLGAGLPKALVAMGGRPLGAYALASLREHPSVDGVVVAVPPGGAADELRAALGAPDDASGERLRWVVGGGSRQESVRRALGAVPEDAEVVVVHDAARPFLPPAVVDGVILAARRHGAAAPALAPVDTVLERGEAAAEGEAAAGRPLDRGRLALVQTPQAFRAELLRAAHAWAEAESRAFTDDVTLVLAFLEREGEARPGRGGARPSGPGELRPLLLPGDPVLRKVTTADDLAWAEARLREGLSPDVEGEDAPRPVPGPAWRVGVGVDDHRLAEGRPLVLCGVRIDHPRGLVGHSDADVAAHAVADALLGAVALGDIGRHFPDSDPRFRGADSLKLLGVVRDLLRERGWRPGNVDVTIVAEEPRLAPFIDEMRERLAGALDLPVGAVSVKATTAEGMGPVGRGEGIRAHAVATVVAAAERGGTVRP